MAVLSLQEATVSFGGPPLFDGVSLNVERKERLALLGRNGAGKSTLLRVLRGNLALDAGKVVMSPGTRVAWLGQKVPRDLEGTVFDIVAGGVAEVGELVGQMHQLGAQLAEVDASSPEGERLLRRFEKVQTKLELHGGWELETRVETAISRLNLPEGGDFATLSGGLKRRVLLARALVAEPDVLLLDEPTNHLDIPAIEWLEELISSLPGAVIFVTHDRSFLANVATRIAELSRFGLASYPGNYRVYLEKREADAEIEERASVKQKRKLAEEEVWVRQGIKARRTRNEGRVRALERLREEVRNRPQAVGQANLRFDQAASSGKHVIEMAKASFTYAEDGATGPWLVKDFSTIISRGDKIGMLGPNGSGKTTLLRLMLRELAPTSGVVKAGTRMEVAYFDQHREQLIEDRSVADNVADGNDRLTIGGRPQHILGYLQRFLFSPEQSRSPVSSLSGGERNRLLLARLFTRSFNVLVMDEPTNDLDIETLELLEDRLVEFSGTLLLVSHDRAFLNNVVTSTLVMEGGGRVTRYAGGYSDWLVQRRVDPFAGQGRLAAASADAESAEPPVEPPAKPDAEPQALPSEPESGARPQKRKLSYKEQRALEQLPVRIETLEARQQELHTKLADPATYNEGGDMAKGLQEELAEVTAELTQSYEQWTELDG